MFLVMRKIQGRTGRAYRKVRRRYGKMLGEVSEALVGADVLRAYGIEERAGRRIGAAVEGTRDSQVRTQRLIVVTFSMGELVAGLVNAGDRGGRRAARGRRPPDRRRAGGDAVPGERCSSRRCSSPPRC